MITELTKVLAAFRAAVRVARAVLDGRSAVLVDDVLAAEACSCSTPRVVGVHDPGSYCGSDQSWNLWHALAGQATTDGLTKAALDHLAHEADRRDGVRRGPR